MLYLRYQPGEKETVLDSVLTEDGHFVFRGSIGSPVQAQVYTYPPGGPYTSRPLYLEPGKMVLTASGPLDSAEVTGTANTPVLDAFNRNGAAYAHIFTSLSNRAYFNRGSKDSVAAIDAELKRIRKEFYGNIAGIIRKYPDARASWDMVYSYRIAMEPKTITPLYSALGQKFKNTPEARALVEQINNVKKIMVGAAAPDFEQKEVSGNQVSLSSLRGKYVLVDFWASWCGICRAENPNLLRAYEAYKNKGFTILGVSLDDSMHREAWINAIEEDGMPWQQVSDLKGRLNEAATLYGIKGIPQNVLINPEGTIIAKNIRNKELMRTLMDIFDKGYNMRLDGVVEGAGDSRIVFDYVKNNEPVSDTVSINEGRFTWLAEMQEPQRVSVKFLPEGKRIQFYSDIGYLQFAAHADSFSSYSLKGSDIQEEANRFQALSRTLDPAHKALLQEFTDAKEEERAELAEKLMAMSRNRYTSNVEKYVRAHPNSLFSLLLVKDMAEDKMGPDYNTVNPLYQSLSPVIRGTPTGRSIAGMLPFMKRSATGTPIADLSQADTSGNVMSLSDFKGRYVLIDFWASWCMPCRAENPAIKKAYNSYHEKGFTVIGVSLDTDSRKWKKAIRDDRLPWIQLSDLKGRENEIARYYNVRGIPWNILVGPDGRIIARALRGPELEKKLSELMN